MYSPCSLLGIARVMLIAMNPSPSRWVCGARTHGNTTVTNFTVTVTGGHGMHVQAIIVVFHLSRRQDFFLLGSLTTIKMHFRDRDLSFAFMKRNFVIDDSLPPITKKICRLPARRYLARSDALSAVSRKSSLKIFS